MAKSAHVHGSMSGLCTGLIKSLEPETRLKIAALGMVTKEPAWKLSGLGEIAGPFIKEGGRRKLMGALGLSGKRRGAGKGLELKRVKQCSTT